MAEIKCNKRMMNCFDETDSITSVVFYFEIIKKDHTNITASIHLISAQELLVTLGCLTYSQLHCVSPNRSVLSPEG